MRDFGTWPYYSPACRRDVDDLLKQGGSLSAYIARKEYGVCPRSGSWASRLEREIEKRFKVKHAVAVNSGTAAIHAALSGLELGGGAVVTSPCTFSATAAAILLAGGVPVFADVDPYTSCITKETVNRAITKHTRAILPVHLFGGLADVQGLMDFGLPVIEDACQAVGARWSGSDRLGSGAFSGTLGRAGCYSFNGGKNIPAGEAGALVTNSDKIAHKARLLMNHGENFGSKQVGYNYRLNEVTACIAYHGLLELEERNSRRIELGNIISNLVWGYKRMSGDHVYYTYAFRVHRVGDPQYRPRFIKRMKRMGIAVQAGYTPPLHTLPAFKKYQTVPLPNAEMLWKQQCLLNCVRPPATEKDMRYVAESMREALR